MDAVKARGVAALQAGRFMPAVSDFSKVLAANARDAEVLFFRATALFRAGDIERAIADFDAVLGLRPNDPDALAGRGLARLTDGDLLPAEADFTQALLAAPHAGALLMRRGQLRVLRGDHAGAARDLTVAMTTNAASPEIAVWRYIAERRSGQQGTAGLGEARKRFAGLDQAQWPLPPLSYFAGTVTAEKLEAAAGEDPQARCEAAYYIGQEALWHGDKDRARRQFTQAISTGARGNPAFIGARIELAKVDR
jgi:lipoprotein NlpI